MAVWKLRCFLRYFQKTANISRITCTHLYTSHSLSRSFLGMSCWGTFFMAAQVSLYFSLYTFPKQPCARVLVEYAICAMLWGLQRKGGVIFIAKSKKRPDNVIRGVEQTVNTSFVFAVVYAAFEWILSPRPHFSLYYIVVIFGTFLIAHLHNTVCDCDARTIQEAARVSLPDATIRNATLQTTKQRTE